jgi:glycosyltransferase involved in cell wall biosynthesis
MKLNIWGSIYGKTGFDVHTRELSDALAAIIGDNLGVDAGKAPNMMEFLQLPERLRRAVKRNYNYETTISILLPDWWALKSGDRLPGFYGFGIFEGDRVPNGWVAASNAKHVTALLVPSEHTRRAFISSGVTKDILIVPHGVNEKVYNNDVKVPKELEDDLFNFLFVGGWKDGIYDRKGLDLALKAYTDEFKPKEKVRFNVKIHAVYGNVDYMRMIRDCVPPADKRAQISVLLNHMTNEQLAGLYKASDAFLMPSKAESFCLPCAEAMACGIPVIAHKFGGQADYIRHNTDGFLVPTRKMVPAYQEGCSPGNMYIYEGAKWGILDIKKLRMHMRYLFDNPGEAKLMGRKASSHMLATHKWSDSADKLLKAVGYG